MVGSWHRIRASILIVHSFKQVNFKVKCSSSWKLKTQAYEEIWLFPFKDGNNGTLLLQNLDMFAFVVFILFSVLKTLYLYLWKQQNCFGWCLYKYFKKGNWMKRMGRNNWTLFLQNTVLEFIPSFIIFFVLNFIKMLVRPVWCPCLKPKGFLHDVTENIPLIPSDNLLIHIEKMFHVFIFYFHF